jgi:hypothetical protein
MRKNNGSLKLENHFCVEKKYLSQTISEKKNIRFGPLNIKLNYWAVG